MYRMVIDNAVRYASKDVLHSSGFEINTFEELYEQDIAQRTIYNYHNAAFYHIFRYQGTGNVHCIGGNAVVSKDDCLLIVNRDILHRYSRNHCRGDMVLFSDNFFAVNEDKSEFLNNCSLFRADYTIIPLQDEKFAAQVDTYYQLMRRVEHTRFKGVTANNVVRNFLHNMLIVIERQHRYQQSLMGALYNFGTDPIVQFKALLNEYYATAKQVAFYAEQMGITEQKLSSLVKSKFGVSAKEYINEKMLTEAVALLENTTLNQGEIAAKLGFDFTYFVKFFRRHYGITPAKYRASK